MFYFSFASLSSSSISSCSAVVVTLYFLFSLFSFFFHETRLNRTFLSSTCLPRNQFAAFFFVLRLLPFFFLWKCRCDGRRCCCNECNRRRHDWKQDFSFIYFNLLFVLFTSDSVFSLLFICRLQFTRSSTMNFNRQFLCASERDEQTEKDNRLMITKLNFYFILCACGVGEIIIIADIILAFHSVKLNCNE